MHRVLDDFEKNVGAKVCMSFCIYCIKALKYIRGSLNVQCFDNFLANSSI